MPSTVFTANEKYERPLLAALLYIQTHLDGDLDLELLSRRAGFSPYHFHRVFGEIIGEPLKAYIRRLRLERAASRLKISDERILRIALDAGFKTHESFTRAFTQRFGVTPSDYRSNFLREAWERKRQLQPRYLTDFGLPVEDGLLPNGSTAAQVRIERVRPIAVAFVRHVGPYDRLLDPEAPIASLWQELFTWGHRTGMVDAGSLLIGIPQDDPSVTPPEKQRFDVCVQVPKCRDPAGHIGCQEIAAGTYGVGRHYGGFENLADTYVHIYDTLVSTGQYALRPAAPFETYDHTLIRGDIRIHFTDVYLPIEKVEKNRNQGERDGWI